MNVTSIPISHESNKFSVSINKEDRVLIRYFVKDRFDNKDNMHFPGAKRGMVYVKLSVIPENTTYIFSAVGHIVDIIVDNMSLSSTGSGLMTLDNVSIVTVTDSTNKLVVTIDQITDSLTLKI